MMGGWTDNISEQGLGRNLIISSYVVTSSYVGVVRIVEVGEFAQIVVDLG